MNSHPSKPRPRWCPWSDSKIQGSLQGCLNVLLDFFQWQQKLAQIRKMYLLHNNRRMSVWQNDQIKFRGGIKFSWRNFFFFGRTKWKNLAAAKYLDSVRFYRAMKLCEMPFCHQLAMRDQLTLHLLSSTTYIVWPTYSLQPPPWAYFTIGFFAQAGQQAGHYYCMARRSLIFFSS